MEVHAPRQLVLPIKMIGDRGEDDRQHSDNRVKNIIPSHACPQITPRDLIVGQVITARRESGVGFSD